MGSATREAIGAATAVLDKQAKLDIATGEQLLAAARVVDGESRLRSALTDDSADTASRTSIATAVFGKYTPAARAVIESFATSRWSSADDLGVGLEELGIRAVAASAPKTLSITNELFSLLAAISSNAELELALGSKLGSIDGKLSLLASLLDGKASKQTVAIVGALISQPRGRRVGELIQYAANLVAQQSGSTIATVTVAQTLTAQQVAKLEKALAKSSLVLNKNSGGSTGGDILINQVVDPDVLGGMRVQLGDEVIDGTIATRLSDLKLRLAG